MGVLGENIRLAMVQKGWSQRDLAHATGLTEVAISRYLAGLREPRLAVLRKLASTLEVSTDFLMGVGHSPKNDVQEAVRLVARNASSLTPDEKAELVRMLFEQGAV